MEVTTDIKRAICSLFEVHSDENGVQRVVTPLEYPGTNDQVVIRVRPQDDGFVIDENGEAVLFAGMCGGDVDSEAAQRWAEQLPAHSPARLNEDEVISAFTADEQLIAPYILRVAEAAQQLHAIATARIDRHMSDFKERVANVVESIAASLNLPVEADVELPIAGGLMADHLLGTTQPLIVIAATSAARLLEAEVIFMKYQADKKPGFILAVAESQEIVGKRQYERAVYYTSKAVIFDEYALPALIESASRSAH
jgi:hypothetical protein